MAAALPKWLRRPKVPDPAGLPDPLQLKAPSVVDQGHECRFSCARASAAGTIETLLVVGEAWPMARDNTPRGLKHVWRDGCLPGLMFGSDSDGAEEAFVEVVDGETLRPGAWTTCAALPKHEKELSLTFAEVHVRLDTASVRGVALDFSEMWNHLSDRGKTVVSTIWRVGPAEVRDVYYARFNGNGPLASYPAGISSGDSKVALLVTWIYHVSRVLPLLWVFTQSVLGVLLGLPVVATLSMAAHRWTVMKDVEHPTVLEQGACVFRDTISILMASPALAMLRKGDWMKTVLTGVGVLATTSLTRRLRNDWVVISKPGRHMRPPVCGETDTSFRLGVGAVLEGWASRGITGWELGLSSEDVLALQGYALNQGTCELFAALSINETVHSALANNETVDSALANNDTVEDETTTPPQSDATLAEQSTPSPVLGSSAPGRGGRPGLRRSSIVDGDGSFMGRRTREFRRSAHRDSGRWQRDFSSPQRVPQVVRTAPWSAWGLGLKRDRSNSSDEEEWDVEGPDHFTQYGSDWKFITDHGVDRLVSCNALGELYGVGLERKLVHLGHADRDVVQTVDVHGGSFVTSLKTIRLIASRKSPLIATYEELMRVSHQKDNGRHLLSLQPARRERFRFKVKGFAEVHPFCRVRKANVLTSVRWFHPVPLAAYVVVSSLLFPSYFMRWVAWDVMVISVLCLCLEPRVGVPAWTRVALSLYQVHSEGWHTRSLFIVFLSLLVVEIYVGTLWIGAGKGWWGALASLGFCPYLSEAAFCLWHIVVTTSTGDTLDSVLAPVIG